MRVLDFDWFLLLGKLVLLIYCRRARLDVLLVDTRSARNELRSRI